MRIRELIEEGGYRRLARRSSTTTCASCARSSARRAPTSARSTAPASSASSTSGSRRREIPVGHGQTRRGCVVTCRAGLLARRSPARWSSPSRPPTCSGASAAASASLGGLPETLVWDREGAIHAGGGRADRAFAAFCGQLAVGWQIFEAADPEAKGALERAQGFMRTTSSRRAASPTSSTSSTSSTPGSQRRQRPHPPRHPRRRPPSASPRSASGWRAARADALDRPPLVIRVPAAALPALRHQRLLARPALRRPPGRGARRPARDHRGRPRHRRGRRAPPPQLRPPPHDHRPRPPAQRSSACAASAAAAPRSRSRPARSPAMTP